MLSDPREYENLPSVKIGNFVLRFELEPPSSELQDVARKELRETSEVQKEAMERLKELLKGDIFQEIRV